MADAPYRTTDNTNGATPWETVIAELEQHIADQPEFEGQLVASLNAANDVAAEQLDELLYQALDWPVTWPDYRQFVHEFATLIPQQSTDPAWVDPQGKPINGVTEHQEIYDRLCHFYWLVDQPIGPDEETLQDDDFFRGWLVQYANVWGAFLDTTESFSPEIQKTFDPSIVPKYRIGDSMIGDPPRPNLASGWLTFNQFFSRELNPGLRPILDPTENTTVVAPADCTYRADYPIDDDGSIEAITIKGTHTYANVKDLLHDSPHAAAFGGGSFVHLFLGPYSYHRFHTPVAGEVLECRPVVGNTFLKVQIAGDTPGTPGHQFQAYDASDGAWEFTQARGIVVIDTSKSESGNVGLVAVVPVGMCQVSSVNMTFTEGATCAKGEEFGYFTFGGSDIIVLFQQDADAEYNPAFDPDDSPYSHYGTLLAHVSAR